MVCVLERCALVPIVLHLGKSPLCKQEGQYSQSSPFLLTCLQHCKIDALTQFFGYDRTIGIARHANNVFGAQSHHHSRLLKRVVACTTCERNKFAIGRRRCRSQVDTVSLTLQFLNLLRRWPWKVAMSLDLGV